MNQNSLSALEIYRDTDQSIALISLHGLNKAVINHVSDMTYEVICGNGSMEVDFQVVELRPGVAVRVPKGTPYQDEGEPFVRLRATSIPPYDNNDVEFLS